MARRTAHTTPAYIDTPAGILGAGGTLFHTTEPMLESYAGPLLDKEPLATFVGRAETWLDAPRTLAIATLPVWLFVLPWPLAVVATLLTYALWALAAPALASRLAVRLVAALSNPVVQAGILLVALSFLARSGHYDAVWAGLAAFVALRLGLVARILDPLLARAQARLYPLPVPDQVLRAFLVRGAMQHGVALSSLREIDASVRQTWKRIQRKS